jgi:hypothetical protein
MAFLIKTSGYGKMMDARAYVLKKYLLREHRN